MMEWIDSHCHLPVGDTATAVVAAAREAGVNGLINVGTDAASSAAAVTAAQIHDGVWATVGVHPHDATNGIEEILGMVDKPRVVAIGECGLDYHYDHSPRSVQREVFATQLALAKEHDLALVIHTRDAWDDTFSILETEGVPERSVFHCFTGGPDEASRGLSLGLMLSFSGIITFPSAGELREAAALCPLDRMLVETDSPYLAPIPHRGKKNQPAFVPLVGEALAAEKGVSVAEVARATKQNTEALFHLN